MRFTPDGVGAVFANTGLNGPMGLASDSVGNLYAANFYGLVFLNQSNNFMRADRSYRSTITQEGNTFDRQPTGEVDDRNGKPGGLEVSPG